MVLPLYETASGNKVKTINIPHEVVGCFFLEDGRSLAANTLSSIWFVGQDGPKSCRAKRAM